ncbi:MAG: Crp/Fnr family transcriptional regulator [Hyphomicrobium sp.]
MSDRHATRIARPCARTHAIDCDSTVDWAEEAVTGDRAPAPVRTRTGSLGVSHFMPRQALYLQGDPCHTIHEIIDGHVSLSRTLADGRRQVLEILGKSMLLGVPLARDYRETAQALGSVRTRLHARGDIETSPRLARMVTTQILHRTENLQNLAVLLGRKTATERVATLLLWSITGDAGSAEAAPRPMQSRIELSQVDIADHLGLSIETVCRVMSRMKKDGLIAFSQKGPLTVVVPHRLAVLAEESCPPKIPRYIAPTRDRSGRDTFERSGTSVRQIN